METNQNEKKTLTDREARIMALSVVLLATAAGMSTPEDARDAFAMAFGVADRIANEVAKQPNQPKPDFVMPFDENVKH